MYVRPKDLDKPFDGPLTYREQALLCFTAYLREYEDDTSVLLKRDRLWKDQQRKLEDYEKEAGKGSEKALRELIKAYHLGSDSLVTNPSREKSLEYVRRYIEVADNKTLLNIGKGLNSRENSIYPYDQALAVEIFTRLSYQNMPEATYERNVST